MYKWADYIISGIWFSDESRNKHITHVLLHADLIQTLSAGRKVAEAEVIEILRSRKTVVTAVWDYRYGKWRLGENVDYVIGTTRTFIRTHRNGIENANLRNLPDMHFYDAACPDPVAAGMAGR